MRILINATNDDLIALYKDADTYTQCFERTITFYYETSPDHFTEIIPSIVTERKVQAADGERVSMSSCVGICIYDHYAGRFRNPLNLDYTMDIAEYYRLRNEYSAYGMFNYIRKLLGYKEFDYSKRTYADTTKPPKEVMEFCPNCIRNKQPTTLDSVIDEASKEVLPKYYFVPDSGADVKVLQDKVNSIIKEQSKLKRTLKIMQVGIGEFTGLHLYFEDTSLSS